MTVPSALPVPATLHRDRLLAVADLLGVHPAGAVMCRLLGVRAGVLRAVVRGVPALGLPEDHLALLSLFGILVRARLADDGAAGDPEPAALARWRAWLRTSSLSGGAGPITPLDALASPAGVAAAIADLRGVAREQRRGRVSLRLLSVVRPVA